MRIVDNYRFFAKILWEHHKHGKMNCMQEARLLPRRELLLSTLWSLILEKINLQNYFLSIQSLSQSCIGDSPSEVACRRVGVHSGNSPSGKAGDSESPIGGSNPSFPTIRHVKSTFEKKWIF